MIYQITNIGGLAYSYDPENHKLTLSANGDATNFKMYRDAKAALKAAVPDVDKHKQYNIRKVSKDDR